MFQITDFAKHPGKTGIAIVGRTMPKKGSKVLQQD